MKIAVMGYSGAGKSTLAKELGTLYGCPVLHLDRVQFMPGWEERDRDEARAMVADFTEQDSWIIDGNYRGFYQDRRLREADRIIYLNFSRLTCLRQAIGRYRTWRGRSRGDMADGCTEKLDAEFVWWILWKGRTRDRRKSHQALCRQYAEKTVILKSRREVERYLTGLRAAKQAADT